MGSSHDFEIAHRGQEPGTTSFCCICNKRLHRWRRRFMGRGHLQNSDVNRSHEPIGIPLNRPPGTFSPTGGKKDGMRGYGSWGGWLYTSRVRGVTRTARRVADRKTNSGNRLCSNARKPLQRARPHLGPLPQEREGASEAFCGSCAFLWPRKLLQQFPGCPCPDSGADLCD